MLGFRRECGQHLSVLNSSEYWRDNAPAVIHKLLIKLRWQAIQKRDGWDANTIQIKKSQLFYLKSSKLIIANVDSNKLRENISFKNTFETRRKKKLTAKQNGTNQRKRSKYKLVKTL